MTEENLTTDPLALSHERDAQLAELKAQAVAVAAAGLTAEEREAKEAAEAAARAERAAAAVEYRRDTEKYRPLIHAYLRWGMTLIRLDPGVKDPVKGVRWSKVPGLTEVEAMEWLARGGNLGVDLLRSNMVDLDAENAAATTRVMRAGFHPTFRTAKSLVVGHVKEGGSHTLLWAPEGVALGAVSSDDDAMQVTLPDGGLIDVLGGRRYAVLPPSYLAEVNGEYMGMAGGDLDGADGELGVADMWLFDAAADGCPAELEAIRGVLALRAPRERVELDARSIELTAAIDQVPWVEWIAGDPRLSDTGDHDGCGCSIWHWAGAEHAKSVTLHESCTNGSGVHFWSGTLQSDLGLGDHASRLDFACALRGESRSAVAASVGIRLGGEQELDVIDADDLEEAAAEAEAAAQAGGCIETAPTTGTRLPDGGGQGRVIEVEVGPDGLLQRAQRLRTAAAGMRKRQQDVELQSGAVLIGKGSVVGAPVESTATGTEAGQNDPVAPPPPEVPETLGLALTRVDGEMPPPEAPLPVARELVRLLWTDPAGRLTLRRWRGDWIGYTGRRWAVIATVELRQAVYVALENAVVFSEDEADEPEGWNPTSRRVDAVLDALSAVVLLPDTVEPQDGQGFVAMANGILDVRTRTLFAHTPEYFSFTCLPYSYDPAATEAKALQGFLRSLWPDDPEPIALIQEWLGYIVSGDTGRQKGLLLIGPPRSGKGTILWLIMMLVGAVNAAGPTLASLCQQFGMAPLIGKSVANVGDARLGSSTSTTVLVERILSLIGEDEQQVDRKYRDPWTGKLRARLTIASNELPRFVDASAAVISRLLIAEMTNSFLGREDEHLKDRLASELPAILNWALDGLDRLNANGKFTRPAASADTEQELEDLASPTKAFVRDECTIGEGKSAVKVDMYRRWENWCLSHGHQAGSQAWFARNLKACGISGGKESTGERRPIYLGVELKSAPSATAGAPGLMGNLTVVRAAG
ncbi:phage/plasmid primase, P4 family [Tsukamurella tyrosinosolvens]|uniref:phage/plasmid primase, P4 family n=1 Tax=Tsukamurella tyrosinosolvens TaxID=57704 RepID=UPI002DD42700|nr:phage/plasmid primase, P4 family [Tsukamurella tyrosinosolvens]MEC4615511.1 phage/plasmid primase, P4 family [Tsukamurella tyrosinosolvens]